MPDDMKLKAVVLHSGGLDSTTVLALAKRDGFEPCAMTFDYGQRHSCEINSARLSAEALGVITRIEVVIDLRAIGGSALTADIDVPKDCGVIGKGIPVTYVPARNTIFLSYALAWAEVIGAHDIYIGVNALDYSGYPDCRPAFIEAYERLANLATRDGVEGRHLTIHAPLIDMTKAEIVRTGASLGVDFGLTHSCYDPTPEGYACGRCDSCLIRIRAFSEAGTLDPIRYAQRRSVVSQ